MMIVIMPSTVSYRGGAKRLSDTEQLDTLPVLRGIKIIRMSDTQQLDTLFLLRIKNFTMLF